MSFRHRHIQLVGLIIAALFACTTPVNAEEQADELAKQLANPVAALTSVPFQVLIGFSDSKWLKQLCVTVYGFSPVQFPPDIQFSKLMHGHDERIPRQGFEWGMETFWTTVTRFVEGGVEKR